MSEENQPTEQFPIGSPATDRYFDLVAAGLAKRYSALARLADRYGTILEKIPFSRRLAAVALLFHVVSIRKEGCEADVSSLALDHGFTDASADFIGILADLSEEEIAKLGRAVSAQLFAHAYRAAQDRGQSNG